MEARGLPLTRDTQVWATRFAGSWGRSERVSFGETLEGRGERSEQRALTADPCFSVPERARAPFLLVGAVSWDPPISPAFG